MRQPKVFFIYCDESRIKAENYMVIGGIIIHSKAFIELKSLIGEYRKTYNMTGELKWQKVSKNKLPHYKAFIDLAFKLIDEGRVNFRCIIIDNRKLKHNVYNQNDAELGFYKMYYQLLFNCFGVDYHRSINRFVVFPDEKPGKYNLADLKSRLNSNMFYKQGNRNAPFGSIEPVNSKSNDFVQMVDILIGAIGYHKNKYHLNPESSLIKLEFAAYIASKVGLKEFETTFRYGGKKFTIWDFNLK